MRKQKWMFVTLIVMLCITFLGPGISTSYASERMVWVHVDTLYRFGPDRGEYDHPGHYAELDSARGAFLRVDENLLEANYAVDVYEEALYGRGPYSHTEDRHARFTWDDLPSSVMSGQDLQIRVNVEVLSSGHTRYLENRSPFLRVYTMTTTGVTSGSETFMTEPVAMAKESDRVGGKAAPGVSINPFGESLEDRYTEGRFAYLPSGGTAVFGVSLPEGSARNKGDQRYVLMQLGGIGLAAQLGSIAYLYELKPASAAGPSGPTNFGLYDPGDGNFHLRDAPHVGFGPKNSTMQPLTGDWNGDGNYTIGLYDPAEGNFWLYLAPGNIEHIGFGGRNSKREAIAGDWNGDGRYGVGLYDHAAGRFFLNCEEVVSGSHGPRGNNWIPVSGDWNGDGKHTLALYERMDGFFHTDGSGAIRFGPKGFNWTPISGDWNGDGTYGVGLHYDGHFHLDTNEQIRFGPRGDIDWILITGRW